MSNCPYFYKYAFLASALLMASTADADWASHQFHYMDMERSECMEIVTQAAKLNGFDEPKTQIFDANVSYGVVYDIDNEGYSFQYTCEPRKGFGYLIINGPRTDKKNNIRDKLGDSIKELAAKRK